MVASPTIPAGQIRPGDYVPYADERIVWRNVPWAHYEAYLALKGEARVPKMSYLEGVLELMSPSRNHEQIKSWIGRLVETWAVERGVSLSAYGAWTLKDAPKEAGAEPDECYIVGDQKKDRPDLAIEVIWTSGGIEKLEIYRRLSVPEVWFWEDDQLTVHALEGTSYVEVEGSRVLSGIDLTQLLSFLDRASMTDAMRDYRAALGGA